MKIFFRRICLAGPHKHVAEVVQVAQHRARIPAFALFVTFGISGWANAIVVPNANAGTNGDTAQFGIFGNGTRAPVVFQWDFAASQLTPLIDMEITGIGFRLLGGAPTITSSTNVGPWDLELSGSMNPIGSLNPTPANNIASNAVTVHDSLLVIPANGLVGGPGPNPFFVIDFTTPFTYTGGDLLMTLAQSNAAQLGVDANTVNSLGDTAACFQGEACRAEFYNYPVTEFQYSQAPEPPSILLITLGAALILAKRRERSGEVGLRHSTVETGVGKTKARN